MKRILLILLVSCLSVSGKAQQQMKVSKEGRIKHLSETFSVDVNQAEEIAAALDYNVEKIRSTSRDTSINPRERQELLRKLHEERQARIRAVLTAEQLAILHAKIAEKLEQQKVGFQERKAAREKMLKTKGIIIGPKKEQSKQK